MIGAALEPEHEMRLLEIARAELDAAGISRALGGGRLSDGNLGQPPADFAHHLLVIHGPRRAHDHASGSVMFCEIILQPRRRLRPHALDRAENRPADRLAGESALLEEIEHEVVGRIGRCADLLHDHALLALQLGLVEGGLGENVGEDIEREPDVLAEHAREVARHLVAGRRIEVAADRLDLLGDLARIAPLGAFERHVLQKMRDAVLGGLLVARAGADPDAECRRLQVRHRIGDDGDPAI